MEIEPLRDSLKFRGKNVVVTGSGTGIGQAIAKKFAENGANVSIMGRRTKPLETTAQMLNDVMRKYSSSGKVLSFPGIDVSDESGISSMFESIVRQFGKIDIVINNAGVSGPVKIFPNANFNDFKECVTIHLTGTFWTSLQAIRCMDKGGKIITISTFFTEENRFEQRPYRFRTPYTSAQGAKNRLGEALAWELVQKGISSIVTNPGPVHSDRIYKTVYPKAAAEFVRISGHSGIFPTEIEKHSENLLLLLGEPEVVTHNGLEQVAERIALVRGDSGAVQTASIQKALSSLLSKIRDIAEKIQYNTSKMIVDGQFLTQDQVADMVLNLADDKITKLLNGKVIPNDRVFYPVKPVVGTAVPNTASHDLIGKVILISTNSSRDKDIRRIRNLVESINNQGAKQTVILTTGEHAILKEFYVSILNLAQETEVRTLLQQVKVKFGQIDGLVHFTGDYDPTVSLLSLQRREWDTLVDDFINIPSLLTKEMVTAMAPDGCLMEPLKFRESNGTVVLVGPDAPVGKKISGVVRARSEVFRGALRPFTTTANQELSDVLGSYIRVFLILAGNIDGSVPDELALQKSVISLLSSYPQGNCERIYYIDEVGIKNTSVSK